MSLDVLLTEAGGALLLESSGVLLLESADAHVAAPAERTYTPAAESRSLIAKRFTVQTFQKDPDAVLPYTVDWSTWLTGEGGDTISSSLWTVSGVTADSDTNDTTSATVWLSGGTVGTEGEAVCQITTAAGRTEDRTIRLNIVER